MVKTNWDTEELIKNWTLLPTELNLVGNKVGANKIGFAVLLRGCLKSQNKCDREQRQEKLPLN